MALKAVGISLDFSSETVLTVNAASHLFCQELLQANLMPTA